MSSLQSSLQAPYSRDIWTGLLRTLFSSSAELFKQPINIPNSGFEGVFTKVLHLGDLKTADGKVAALLDIEVVPEISLSRNRAGIRHLAARLIDGTQRQAILAAFHSAASPDWRFSFIIREKTFDIATGEIRTTETPACRFTYLLGPNEKCRTAAERFATLSGTNSTLKNIEAAFKVDQLTKEFYSELSDWYFWALTRVRFPDDEEKNEEKRNATMTIRLITRLIFVWFLKKKNIIPECLFEKTAVDEWLNNSDSTGSTYYKAVLQNLFFATLNFDPKEGQRGFVEWGKKGVLGYRYLRFFKRDAAEKFLDACKDIPFLNGGLFENLDKQPTSSNPVRIDCFSNLKENEPRLAVPDDLFFSQEQIVNLSAFYDDKRKSTVKVKGLFDILNAYNFTVEESTPYDKDVALDPELLGQVFENLLASYNPETKTTARKQTGSFYTPREIVQYMVDESIVAHLKQTVGADLELEYRKLTRYGDEKMELTEKQKAQIVKALTTCRILDPACGSGAFPMGILQQLVHMLNHLDPDNKHLKEQARKQVMEEGNLLGDDSADSDDKAEKQQETLKLFDTATTRPDYARKLLLIENSIYGVDIQPVAVQISKLRFFISLVVEQNPNEEIRPLPNLETNFVAANTLINIDKPELLTDDPQIKAIENELKANRHRRFFARTTSVKQKCEREDKRLREKLKNRLVGLVTSIDQETIDTNLARIEKYKNERAKYSDEVWQVREEPTQSDFFGNPNPEQQKLSLRVDANKEKRDNIDAGIRACEIKIEKEYAKAKGNSFTKEAEKLANWDPYDQNASSEFFDSEWMFGITDGFDIVIGNPPYGRILGAESEKPLCHVIPAFSPTKDAFVAFTLIGLQIARQHGCLMYIMPTSWLSGPNYTSFRDEILKVAINEIVVLPFDMFASAYVDTLVVSMINTLPAQSHIVRTQVYPKKQHVERFDTTQTELIIQNEWHAIHEHKFLLTTKAIEDEKTISEFCHSSFSDVITIKRGVLFDQNILLPQKGEGRLHPYFTGDVYRYELHVSFGGWLEFGAKLKEGPKDFSWFEGERILLRRLMNRKQRLMATYASETFITNKNLYSIKQKTTLSLKFILALLNSSLVSKLYVNRVSQSTKDDFPQVTISDILALPFPHSIPSEKQQQVIDLVDRILAARTADPTADITDLEAEIDRHVYTLYHLTAPEIEIVEGTEQ